MSYSMCPRRSLLIVPAGNARALAASDDLAADGLLYDLSETVTPADKSDARERLRDHLAASRFPGERVVRINGLDTEWGTEDFLAARGANVDAIVLTRVEEPGIVRQIVSALHETDAPERLKLWAMIETPLGVLNAASIAAEGSGRLSCLVVGIALLKLSSGMRPDADRSELLPALSAVALAAKAHSLSAIDGYHADVRDLAGFAAECGAARRLGFDGKVLIHPSQIDGANAAFQPDADAAAWAQKVMEAFAVSPDMQNGVATLDGRTIDRLHLTEADRILKLGDAIAARTGTGAQTAQRKATS
ncbi:CoA ester lyase [Fulvimarina sp. 2208YS6-2-32]|uniref:CoA ester lyase n=1 Tax=Fulvimarina uroteuthidis TaxID=3098149 RepID=A0ABU5HXF3_9HYPH|nr:CoA ester lyase [Fulvimarina sp. 2208YS6-2-32]MDY8107822.1 CoA ester lyase [Fulvimarina sp. 2208YS6-2-32]